MSHALTLVSAEANLSAGIIAVTEAFLDEEGLAIESQPTWLCEHKAVDIQIHDALCKDQMDSLRKTLDEHKIDIFCTALENRRKKLLCADMESTIIKNEMLEELAEVLNLHDKIAAITARAMNGEIGFVDSLMERVSLLKDLPESTLTEFVEKLHINEGAQTMVQTMKAHGALCILITGGFETFTMPIAMKVGFDHHFANDFDIADDKLTGKLKGDIVDPGAKLKYLHKFCETLSIDPSQAMAIGDGANDLPMLNEAGLGIGYHPKPVLQDTLINQIRHTDFTATLYAQGYKKEEFKEG